MDITPGRVALSQKRHITDILKRFPSPVKPSRPPMTPGIIRRADTSMLLPQPFPLYPSIIGALLYLAVWTRPDISNATQKLSRVLSCPTEDDLAAAYRILDYLANTLDLQIVYSAGVSPLLEVFCDSDYASDALSIPPRRSTSGSVVLLAGGPILWGSRTQPSVALSTCEAEYMAAGAASRDALWLRHLLPEFGFQETCITIQCDNQACLFLIANPNSSHKSKHIDIMHHFLRERVVQQHISFQYVQGDCNVADLFTKPLDWPQFRVHRDRLLQPS